MMFSVVTPSFRQFDYLARCASSVSDQSFSGGVEHIIQDGGGGPGFGDFSEFASTIENLHLYSESDDGMYNAINRGFERTQGEIISWLNCDEQYLPQTLEKVARWFELNPDKDVLFGDVVLIDTEGGLLSYRKAIVPNKRHIVACFLPTYSAATFVRRRVLEEHGLLDDSYKAIADAIWVYNMLDRGVRAGVLSEPLAVFTQTGGNLGQTEVSHMEHELWRKQTGVNSELYRYLLGLNHRLRKLFNGAYFPRFVKLQIYISSLKERQIICGMLWGLWKTKKR